MVTSGTLPVTATGTSTICATVTTTVTVLVNNGGNIAVWIVGVIVLASLLAVSIIVILILVMFMKRTNINQKRKSDNDIVMECSPAYATTEFKTNTADDVSVKDGPTYDTVQQSEQTQSTVEPVYDTTNDEYGTSLPPPAEYEIPTVTDL
ncbi:PREDICTED: uncharacterized protein LOC109589767 [Amphimedon queenslandica]|uniref:Uncharacterized protein n=1 Tax=Amphimedon queenslandica TaxID=400682 RepID=A0AAN0JWR5_AMPQE|nr:PREDICTED: uncharacterized protein LOC109589767 [Amphimedon queenslandica]|eukprot:XP_019861346.1 PREDICTED: uncharacterized protein LOC109589767 [Amphimedon queenslandica]